MSEQHPTTCERVRGRFHAYRGGGLAELERAFVAKHLDVCAACRAELWLQAQLEDSAKQRPAPLTDGQKSAILERVHAAVAVGGRDDARESQAREWRERLARWFASPAVALPRFALAGSIVAAVAFVVVGQWRGEDRRGIAEPAGPSSSMTATAPTTVGRVTGVVVNGRGVHAIALAPSALRLERGTTGDALSLTAGRVAIEFDRRASNGPLRIELPQGIAIVRGTVLVVSVEAERARVAVQHGLVEVQPAGSSSVFVRSGEEISFGAGTIVKGALGAAEAAELEALWPKHEATVSTSAAAAGERDEPVVIPPSALGKKARGEESASAPVPMEGALEITLSEARALEARGERRAAIECLERGLAGAKGVESRLVGEARYRLASLYRVVGELARAAEVLGMIAGSSEGETAQLASFERGRVLVELGVRAEGMAALRAAAQGKGPVADDALAAMCVALAQDSSGSNTRGEPADCVSEHRARFPESPHRVAVDALLTGRAAPALER